MSNTMKPVERRLIREILRHKTFYGAQCVPFLQAQNPHTIASCLGLSPSLARLVMPSSKRPVPSITDAIRAAPSLLGTKNTLQLGMEALQWLRFVQKRLAVTEHKSLVNVKYAFRVGDIVRHGALGQIGVVAAQLPVCFASDEWLMQNLGSTADLRLEHPWYLILVSNHTGLPRDFSRYGSELTHEKLTFPTSIGMNRNLPLFFSGFDAKKGRYIRRNNPTPPFRVAQEEPKPVAGVALQNLSLEAAARATSL